MPRDVSNCEGGVLSTFSLLLHYINEVSYNGKVFEIDVTKNGKTTSYEAEVISTDRQNDLAILKITSSNFKPLSKLSYNFNTNIQDVGSSVFALGYPLTQIMGNEIKFTDGKISGINEVKLNKMYDNLREIIGDKRLKYGYEMCKLNDYDIIGIKEINDNMNSNITSENFNGILSFTYNNQETFRAQKQFYRTFPHSPIHQSTCT